MTTKRGRSTSSPARFASSREKDCVSEEKNDYAAYLLRLRRSDQAGQPIWRASLESTRNTRRLDFANLEALIAFLRDRFGQAEQNQKHET